MKKTRWDLKKIYKNVSHWDADLKLLKKLTKSFPDHLRKVSNAKAILNVLKFEKKIDTLMFKLGLHLILKEEEYTTILDGENPYTYKQVEYNSVCNQYCLDVVDLEYNILKIEKQKLYKMLNMKVLKSYAPRLNQIFYQKKIAKKDFKTSFYTDPISDKIQLMYNNILNDIVSFGSIQTAGNSAKKITQANIPTLEKSHLRQTRKNIYIAKYKALLKTKKSFSYALNSFLQIKKMDARASKVSLINSILEYDELREKNIPKIFNSLIKNNQLAVQFLNIKKIFLRSNKVNMFDNESIFKAKAFTVKEAYSTINKVSKVLNNNSDKIIKRLKNNNHIFMTNKTKKNVSYVGYSMSYGTTDPYLFIRYMNDIDSAMTLAHELGHAFHQTQLNKHNDFWSRDTSLIVHETASYTHELLFLLTAIRDETSKKEKKILKLNLLNYYYKVLFDYGIKAKFEYHLYKEAEKNKSFSPEHLSKKYGNIMDSFTGSAIEQDELRNETWIGNQRFFEEFYYLKYIIAFSIAVKISNKIIEGDSSYISKFNNMMKKGLNSSIKDIIGDFECSLSSLDEVVKEACSSMESILSSI